MTIPQTNSQWVEIVLLGQGGRRKIDQRPVIWQAMEFALAQVEAASNFIPATIALIGRVKVVEAKRSDLEITVLIGQTVPARGPAAIGGRSIIPACNMIGINGITGVTTIGPTSITIGIIAGATIGTIAIAGSTTTGGTIIRAMVGAGRTM
jgi:hypothetical protein